jgi:hypothetical protein
MLTRLVPSSTGDVSTACKYQSSDHAVLLVDHPVCAAGILFIYLFI